MGLGEAIGSKLYGAAKVVEPMVESHLPKEYEKWVPFLVQWACKAIAVYIAWWIQRILSAVHSAVRGAFLCSRYVVEYLKEERGIDLAGRFGEEVVPWSLALLGLVFQFAFGFGVPFPLNLFTWPISLVEYFVVYTISVSTGGVAEAAQ